MLLQQNDVLAANDTDKTLHQSSLQAIKIPAEYLYLDDSLMWLY